MVIQLRRGGVATRTDEKVGWRELGKMKEIPQRNKRPVIGWCSEKPVSESGQDAITGTRNCCLRLRADEHA